MQSTVVKSLLSKPKYFTIESYNILKHFSCKSLYIYICIPCLKSVSILLKIEKPKTSDHNIYYFLTNLFLLTTFDKSLFPGHLFCFIGHEPKIMGSIRDSCSTKHNYIITFCMSLIACHAGILCSRFTIHSAPWQDSVGKRICPTGRTAASSSQRLEIQRCAHS